MQAFALSYWNLNKQPKYSSITFSLQLKDLKNKIKLAYNTKKYIGNQIAQNALLFQEIKHGFNGFYPVLQKYMISFNEKNNPIPGKIGCLRKNVKLRCEIFYIVIVWTYQEKIKKK